MRLLTVHQASTFLVTHASIPVIHLMKLAVVFLLLSSSLFAQGNDSGAMHLNESFDSLVIGDWQLAQVEIIDGYNMYTDTNRFKSHEARIKEITITSDSLYNHRDTMLRYYVGNQNFSYNIEYDSIMKANYLKLYAGKKRKSQLVETYELVRCTIDELVIRSYQFLHHGLDYTSISIVYTYRKKGVTDVLREISGDWFHCSDRINSFMTENDSLTYDFTRTPQDASCEATDTRLNVEFVRENYENVVNLSVYYVLDGVFGKLRFSVDPENELIFIRTQNKMLVYKFSIENNEKLSLSLDIERTHAYNVYNME